MAFQPWQGGGQPHPWAGHVASMRAAHADRERAVDVLKAGFAEGRLRQDEYEQRVSRAYQAQTYAELQRLIADLPQGPVPQQPPLPQPYPGQPHPVQTFARSGPPVNGAATGALVCGLLTPLTWGLTGLPAMVLGYKARAEIRRTGERGEGNALTGIIMGWLAVGGWSLFLLLSLVLTVAF